MGDLPAHVASQQPAARVGNADACLISLRPPQADQRLSRLPRSFMVGEDRVWISRPGQRGLMPSQGQSASALSGAVSISRQPRCDTNEGSRPIRTRQRAQRAARGAAQLPEHAASRSAAQPGAVGRAAASPLPTASRSAAQSAAAAHLSSAPQPRSAALQDLETAVARIRHGPSDRRGLGFGPTAPAAAPHRAAFVAALAPTPPEDMDCTPPVAAMVLPAREQATDMDIDASQIPATPPSPQPMQIERPQVAPDVRDELMEWMDSHTALSMQQRRAAMAQVHAHMPDLLLVQPTPQPVYAALCDIDAAETQRQISGKSRPIRQRRSSPAILHGFELQAAHAAVARATAGLRRST